MIADVAVKPELRRSGLAFELCTRLDQAALGWELGTPTLLMQVPQDNVGARWLCAKLGFREGFRGRAGGGGLLRSGGRQEDPTKSIDGLSVSLLDLAFRGLAAGEEGEGEAPVLVTLGKRCGPVTWRLMAPKPPF